MGCLFSKTKDDTKADEKTTPAAPAATTTEPAAPAPRAGSDVSFAQQLLDAQNSHRANHGSPPMVLSEELTAGAQQWADTIAQKDELKHTDDRTVGENLAWGKPSLTADRAAQMWYDEIKDYDFGNPGFNGSTGHFTQLVWKASTEFGGATATSASGGVFVVGRYRAPGNVTNAGFFEENVKPAN